MRKLIQFAVLLIIVYSLFYQGTMALFSSVVQSTTNTFTAATVFPTLSPTPSPTPSVANHVVISEVQITGGPGNTAHDFIELYNPTDSPIDINGHRLVKRTGNSSSDTLIKSWTVSTIIQSHGFYLWASNDDSDSPYIIIADTTTSQSLGASTSIALRQGPNDTGVLIDVLSWNSGSTLVEGTTFSPDPGAGQSMERKAYSSSTPTSMSSSGVDELKGNGYDTDNNASDFILRPSSQAQNTSSPTEIP